MKISIPDKGFVIELGGIIPDRITAIQLAPGDESLFVYDKSCNLKLIHVIYGTTIHDFGRVNKSGFNYGVQGMLVTGNGEYLFTSSDAGEFKQFSVRGRALVQDFGNIAKDIWAICD